MSKAIFDIINGLDATSNTTRVLKALDWVVPGEYPNLVGFTASIKAISGVEDEATVQLIGERCIQLYNDKSEGYGKAMWLYQVVESVSNKAGYVALAHRMGKDVGFLGFLDNITPKTEATQTFDFALKLVTEIACFCQLNGLPGDSVGDFVAAFTDAHYERQMRMAALICLDGLIPLGPDFLAMVVDRVQGLTSGDLAGNARFKAIEAMLPGDGEGGKLAFVKEGVTQSVGSMQNFVNERGLTQGKLLESLEGFLQGAGDKLDYVGAFLDVAVAYYEHTGAQSVMRSLVDRAVGEV